MILDLFYFRINGAIELVGSVCTCLKIMIHISIIFVNIKNKQNLKENSLNK